MKLSLTPVLPASSILTVHAFEPTWPHFTTESANKAAPHYDLSHYGIAGGQLPKVYSLTGGQLTYKAEASYVPFQEIKAGHQNRTQIPDQALAPDHSKRTTAGPGTLDACACFGINLDLYSTCAAFEYHNSCVSAASINQGGCTWDLVNVFNVQDAYITFWSSSACNGKKGNFNPHREQGSGQDCQFNVHWGSSRVYSGCHSGFQSNC